MIIPAALALSIVLAGGAAWAQTARPSQQKTQVKLASASWYDSGTVVAVDASRGRLRVKCVDGKVRAFAAKRARIDSIEGKTIALADLSIGDEVSLAYEYSVKGKEAIDVLRLRRAVKK
ncbi:MAG: FecR domain-containing protein [Elusimicrobia bacterium]|nr:FecR domain-containing protein [Elusimicrobiota bacterium]